MARVANRMAELTFFASPSELEIGVRLPWGSVDGSAWDRVAETFLDVALGGRGVWIATVAEPANLDWTNVTGGHAGEVHELSSKRRRRHDAEFGYIENFDERVARAIIRSSDFQWDSVFLFPRARQKLDEVIATLENIDVRSAIGAELGEFICSTGDGIGLRWFHPNSVSDIERIKRACAEQGFTLVSIDSSQRAD